MNTTYRYGRLIKVSRLKEPKHTSQSVGSGQGIEGNFENPPTLGERFFIESNHGWNDYISTSAVKSIYVVGQSDVADKLVLPTGFPEPERLVLDRELKQGDVLFATHNSMYLLTDLEVIE